MRRFLMALPALFLFMSPARADAVATAFDAALGAFRAAAPHLSRDEDGVDVAAYGEALAQRHFLSSHWGGTVGLDIVAGRKGEGGCERFAAYVRIPPQDGRIPLVICPEFSREGADALRRLTILHEMVHVVAGPDECRAMAFAARVETLAFGSFTPVDRYWQANRCDSSAFSLP